MKNRKLVKRLAVLLAVSVLALAAGQGVTLAGPENAPMIYLQYAQFDPLQGEPNLPAAQLELAQANPSTTYLLQFSGPVMEDWVADVEAAGARLYGYVPDYTFIARIDAQALDAVRALPFVRWVGPFYPAYRMPAGFQAQAVKAQSGADPSVPVTVLTLPDVNLDDLAARSAALGAETTSQALTDFAGTLQMNVPADRLSALAAQDGVLWVEPYLPRQLFNDVAGGTIMHANNVRNALHLYGANQIVAVADTGLDVGNPATISADFSGRIVKGMSICANYNGGRTTWNDFDAHGTHVAGSVLGSGVLSGSNPAAHQYGGSFAGVAPEARLVFQAIDNAPGGGLECIPDDMAAYIFGPAYTQGARVHTNSWGGPTGGTAQSPQYGGYDAISARADEAAWKYKDLLILYAAGNSGIDANADGLVDPDSLGSPGTAKDVLTVGASENNRPAFSITWGLGWPADFTANPIADDQLANNINGMAAFSSRGPTDDGRIKPDITAPGTFIISDRSHDPAAGTGWGVYDANYIYEGGTSMATPLTAGAAAVVREWLVKSRGILNPSAALMKAALINGAADMSPGQYTNPQEIPNHRPNIVSGWGRVDLDGSLNPASPRKIWVEDNNSGLNTGATITYQVTIGNQLALAGAGGDSPAEAAPEAEAQAEPAIEAPAGEPSLQGTPEPQLTPEPPGRKLQDLPREKLPGAESVSPGSPAGTSQLLQNPGFESGTSPWVLFGLPSLSTLVYHSGVWSAHFGGYDLANDQVYQTVSVPANASSATVEFWYKTQTVETFASADYFCFGMWDLSGNVLWGNCWWDFGVSGTVGWTKLSYTLTAQELALAAGQNVLFGYQLATDFSDISEGWIDDIALNVTTPDGQPTPTFTPTPTKTPTPTATSTQSVCPLRVVDGGFEQAVNNTTHPNWNVSGNARFTINQGIAHGGKNAAIMGWTDTPATGDLWQASSLPAGLSSGDLSFYYQTQGDGSFTLDVDITDGAGAVVNVHVGTLTSATSTWQQFSHTFTAGELASLSGKSTRLRFRIRNVSGPENVNIDDVSWHLCAGSPPTPTPTPKPVLGGPLHFTLVWTDYPGLPLSARNLVNDLDLEVIAPDGSHYYGNAGTYASGQCLRDGKWDACNTVEGLTIPKAQYGTYSVIVHGVNIPQGGQQPFALAGSGDYLRQGGGPAINLYLPVVRR